MPVFPSLLCWPAGFISLAISTSFIVERGSLKIGCLALYAHLSPDQLQRNVKNRIQTGKVWHQENEPDNAPVQS